MFLSGRKQVILIFFKKAFIISKILLVSICCCCCLIASVVSDSVWPHRWQPTRLPRPWDSPGKNIGVGCHFLLQCMKVKSESQVAQSCPILSDPMDCSLPGSSVHGIFQARVLEWGAIGFSEYLSTDWKTKHSTCKTCLSNLGMTRNNNQYDACCCLVMSVLSNSVWPHGLPPARLLCPCSSLGKKLEWVAMPSSRESSWPTDWTRVSSTVGRFFTTDSPGKPIWCLWTF